MKNKGKDRYNTDPDSAQSKAKLACLKHAEKCHQTSGA